jgi:hypothetical protein
VSECVCVWCSTSWSLAGFAGSKTCDLVCTLLAKERAPYLQSPQPITSQRLRLCSSGLYW